MLDAMSGKEDIRKNTTKRREAPNGQIDIVAFRSLDRPKELSVLLAEVSTISSEQQNFVDLILGHQHMAEVETLESKGPKFDPRGSSWSGIRYKVHNMIGPANISRGRQQFLGISPSIAV
ncbi:hypothetical protein Trydic_g15744 [Trypoxylus dichotomus]